MLILKQKLFWVPLSNMLINLKTAIALSKSLSEYAVTLAVKKQMEPSMNVVDVNQFATVARNANGRIGMKFTKSL